MDSTAYHPQTNGLAERTSQTMKQSLRGAHFNGENTIFCHSRKWPSAMPLFLTLPTPRTTSTTAFTLVVKLTYSTLVTTRTSFVSADISHDAWVQAGLPIRLGGLGLTHCLEAAPLAFVASSFTFSEQSSLLRLPVAASFPNQSFSNHCGLIRPSLSPVVTCLTQVIGRTRTTLKNPDTNAISQRWWTYLLHRQSLRELTSRHSSTEPSITPPWLVAYGATFLQAGSKLLPQEFEVLLKSRLHSALLQQRLHAAYPGLPKTHSAITLHPA